MRGPDRIWVKHWHPNMYRMFPAACKEKPNPWAEGGAKGWWVWTGWRGKASRGCRKKTRPRNSFPPTPTTHWSKCQGLGACKLRGEPGLGSSDCPLYGKRRSRGSNRQPWRKVITKSTVTVCLAGLFASMMFCDLCAGPALGEGGIASLRSKTELRRAKSSYIQQNSQQVELWTEEPLTPRLMSTPEEGRTKMVRSKRPLRERMGPGILLHSQNMHDDDDDDDNVLRVYYVQALFFKALDMLSHLTFIVTISGKYYYPHLTNFKPEHKRSNRTSPRSDG